MASREDIDRVRSAVNILDVVAPYTALKRSGSRWKGCCPFHSEKTPSFDVNPNTGYWRCYGQCSEGGDVFKFLEKADNLGFGEALDRLAQMAGITLTNDRQSIESSNKRDKLHHALEIATRFYEETLAASPGARQYLQDRGIAHATQKSFRLGFAGDTYDGAATYLRKNGVNIADAVEAGILTGSDRQFNAPYDKLRGRIICPILDVHDRPIAFGGRLIEDVKDRPKYINTAETPLFSKGKTLYAMSRARRAIADLENAIIVEGYFDVISPHQAGFNNVIATLGTSLTADHADQLSRHTGKVTLAFDADAAGLKAAQRANAIFESKEFEVQVLDMPPGQDPDSLLRAQRVADFQKAIDDAVPIREFQLRAIMAQYQARPDLTERDKSAVFRREIVPLIKSTRSVIERERYIRLAAALHPFYDQGSGLAEDQIRQEVTGVAGQQASKWVSTSRVRRESSTGLTAALSTKALPPSGIRLAELNLLRALCSEDHSLRTMARERVTAELFVSPVSVELARRMLFNEGAPDLMGIVRQAEAADTLNAELSAFLSKLMMGDLDEPPLTMPVIEDSILRLKKEQDASIERTVRVRAEQGDVAAARELMQLLRKHH